MTATTTKSSAVSSPTHTPDTLNTGSGSSTSQGGNPAVFIGVVVGLIIFLSLLCAWCCKKRCCRSLPKQQQQQQVAGYPLQHFAASSYPEVPQQVVVHNQGSPWPAAAYPAYPPQAPSRSYHPDGSSPFAPRQMTTIPEAYGTYGGGHEQLPTTMTSTSLGYSLPTEYYTPSEHARNSARRDPNRLSLGSRFPIRLPHQ